MQAAANNNAHFDQVTDFASSADIIPDTAFEDIVPAPFVDIATSTEAANKAADVGLNFEGIAHHAADAVNDAAEEAMRFGDMAGRAAKQALAAKADASAHADAVEVSTL